MSVQFIMLIAVSVIQGHKDWYNSYTCPAKCLSGDLHLGGVPKSWMIANIVLLSWSYGSALIPMFSWILNAYKLLKKRLRAIFGSAVSRKFHLIVHAIDSMTFNIIFTSMWWIWGAVNVSLDRISGKPLFCPSSNDKVAPTENAWGFGQVVPMVLLLAPFLTLVDSIGKYREGASRRVLAVNTVVANPDVEGHLAFNKDDVIKVLHRRNKREWEGSLHNHTALFSVADVTVLKPNQLAKELAKEARDEVDLFTLASIVLDSPVDVPVREEEIRVCLPIVFRRELTM